MRFVISIFLSRAFGGSIALHTCQDQLNLRLGNHRCFWGDFFETPQHPLGTSQSVEVTIATLRDITSYSYSDSEQGVGEYIDEGYIVINGGQLTLMHGFGITVDNDVVLNGDQRPQYGLGYLSSLSHESNFFVLAHDNLLIDPSREILASICETQSSGGPHFSDASIYPEIDVWAVNARAVIGDLVEEEFAAEFFAIDTYSLWTTIPNNVYESFIREIELANIPMESIQAISNSIHDDTYIRVPNCQEVMDRLPTIFFAIDDGENGTSVVLSLDAYDYIPDLETCTLTVRGVSAPQRNSEWYPTIGENILRHVNVAFDRSARRIGFCDPLQ